MCLAYWGIDQAIINAFILYRIGAGYDPEHPEASRRSGLLNHLEFRHQLFAQLSSVSEGDLSAYAAWAPSLLDRSGSRALLFGQVQTRGRAAQNSSSVETEPGGAGGRGIGLDLPQAAIRGQQVTRHVRSRLVAGRLSENRLSSQRHLVATSKRRSHCRLCYSLHSVVHKVSTFCLACDGQPFLCTLSHRTCFLCWHTDPQLTTATGCELASAAE